MQKIEMLANKSGAKKILSRTQLMKIYGGFEDDESLDGCGTCTSGDVLSTKRDCTKSTNPNIPGCNCPFASGTCVK